MEMHYTSAKKVDSINKNPLLSGDKRVCALVEARGIEPLQKVYKVAIIARFLNSCQMVVADFEKYSSKMSSTSCFFCAMRWPYTVSIMCSSVWPTMSAI